jgi:type I restriction enzyme R subunit
VQSLKEANLDASRGVAIRELHMKSGFADYVLYVDRRAVGVVEAKPAGTTLTGIEPQTAKYATGMLAHLPRVCDPLPFLYQSTGVEGP